MAAALAELGHVVKLHDELFSKDTPDTSWLATVGRAGWVVLTKDRHIRTRANELAELIAAGVAAFVLTLRRPRPFIARVSSNGGVEMLALRRRAERDE